MSPLVAVQVVEKSIPLTGGRNHLACKGIDLEIRKGEFISLIGHSCCGKSTLLNMIAGLDLPIGGTVLLEGEVVMRPGPDKMVVFQNFSLLPWLSVRENIALATKPKLLLLDEPFGALDAQTRGNLQEKLMQICNEHELTALMVTHDIDKAVLLSDCIVMLTNGPAAGIGEILTIDFARPRSREDIMEDPRYYELRNSALDFHYNRFAHEDDA